LYKVISSSVKYSPRSGRSSTGPSLQHAPQLLIQAHLSTFLKMSEEVSGEVITLRDAWLFLAFWRTELQTYAADEAARTNANTVRIMMRPGKQKIIDFQHCYRHCLLLFSSLKASISRHGNNHGLSCHIAITAVSVLHSRALLCPQITKYARTGRSSHSESQ
jgi:hypothetical protein